MKMLSASPVDVGVYREETETNLHTSRLAAAKCTTFWVDLLVVDRAEELETRSKFLLRPVSLNDGADDGDVDVFRTDVVCGRDACDVEICRLQ